MTKEKTIHPSSFRLHPWRSRLFTILAAISMLLCVATVALWARSYWREDWLSRLAIEKNVRRVSDGIGSMSGEFLISRTREETSNTGISPLPGTEFHSDVYDGRPPLQHFALGVTFAGFGWYHGVDKQEVFGLPE